MLTGLFFNVATHTMEQNNSTTSSLKLRLTAYRPKRYMNESRHTHPWLTKEVEDLVLAKHAAQGTDGELTAAEACSEAILKEHRAFAQKSADEMRQLKPGNKAWWSKSRKLLELKPRCTSIPALKTDDGTWKFRAVGKAEMLADTFRNKYQLIPCERNKFTDLPLPDLRQSHQNIPSEQEASNILQALNPDSATGPDYLPARILKECCQQLAKPFRMLALLILKFGIWPESWMMHWIVPLFKKGATFIPGNYRGIHLTPQISNEWSASSV